MTRLPPQLIHYVNPRDLRPENGAAVRLEQLPRIDHCLKSAHRIGW
jgi:hypothetical protein